jgi:hypothetical protein
MKSWGKMAIGTGALLLAGTFGYLRLKRKHKNSCEDDKEYQEATKDIPVSLLQLMEEVTIESLEQLYSCTEKVQRLQRLRKSTKDAMLVKLQRSMENSIGKIEEEVCANNNWTLADYIEQIELRKAVNNEEVVKRVNLLNTFVTTILEGKKPEVIFDFDSKLTKSLTIMCYRLILMSHLYTSYRAVHDRLAKDEKIDKKRYEEIIISTNPEKEHRRYINN